jgi:hypothetical protein
MECKLNTSFYCYSVESLCMGEWFIIINCLEFGEQGNRKRSQDWRAQAEATGARGFLEIDFCYRISEEVG